MFSENLNLLLKQRNLSALALAKAIEVPKSIVYEWKNGQREPSIDNLLKLADFFGVSLEYLTGRPEVRDPAEDELIVLLRAAKTISRDDHDALMRTFKENLDSYLRSCGNRGNTHGKNNES